MKKTVGVILATVALCAFCAQATTLSFNNTGGPSTGDYLDNMLVSGTQTNVPEISGLNITATFGAVGGTVDYLNATTTQLGINSDLLNEGTSYFDTGEWLALAFDKDVNVTRFKFANFTAGDSVKITWNTTILTLNDADLNGVNEYVVDWDVSASDTIRFDAMGKSTPTSTSGGFGLLEMDMTVVPEPATFAMLGFGGLVAIFVRRASRK